VRVESTFGMCERESVREGKAHGGPCKDARSTLGPVAVRLKQACAWPWKGTCQMCFEFMGREETRRLREHRLREGAERPSTTPGAISPQ
jgi:hypothetical protein